MDFPRLSKYPSVIVTLIIAFCTSEIHSKRHFYGTEGFDTIIQAYPRTDLDPPILKQSTLCSTTNDGGTYRYHRPTGRCFVLGEQAPCGEMMEFTMLDRNFGVCDCSQKLRCGRPLVYWPPGGRCYPINEGGPCLSGHWLTLGQHKKPFCERNPCETQMTQSPSLGSSFWFADRGRCFKTGTRAFCASNEVALNKWKEYKPQCYVDDTVLDCDDSYVHKVECLPGMKQDFKEICTKERLKKKSGSGSKISPEEVVSNIYFLHLE